MSGWKIATIDTDADTTKEVNMKINELDKEEENFKKLSDDSFGMRGYDADIKDKAGEILKATPVTEEDKVLIIEANDTTSSGDGTLYRIKDIDDNGGITLSVLETKAGYEGAMARDVTGYFREEHNINSFSRLH